MTFRLIVCGTVSDEEHTGVNITIVIMRRGANTWTKSDDAPNQRKQPSVGTIIRLVPCHVVTAIQGRCVDRWRYKHTYVSRCTSCRSC